MTTRITIANDDLDRAVDVYRVAVGRPVTADDVTPAFRLQPGQISNDYVHSGQMLLIKEVPAAEEPRT